MVKYTTAMKKMEEPNDKKELSRYIKVFGQYKKQLIGIIVFLVLTFPAVSLWIMKAVAMKGSCLYVPDNVNPWFGYSASYLGAAVSICIGLLTIELTLMLDQNNKEDQKKQQEYHDAEQQRWQEYLKDKQQKQQEYSVATNMPDLTCQASILYDCSQDMPSGHLDRRTSLSDYILELHLTPAFPIYFDIKIKRLSFLWKTLYVENHISKVKEQECRIELHENDYHFTNNEDFELAVYFNIEDEWDMAFQNFYESYLRSTHDIKYGDDFIEVMIWMECQNVLLSNQDRTGDIPFELCLTMKNMGKKGDGKGISLKTVNRKIRR